MTKKDIPSIPGYFQKYIDLVDGELTEALEAYAPEKVFYEKEKLIALKNKVYELGKWPVKNIIQHCIDTERIMAYRALSISRGEQCKLPGFDQDSYGNNTISNLRTIDDLLEEYILVRKCNIYLFKNMDNRMILREGLAGSSTISPLALGYIIIGHGVHHMNVIRNKYFPILEDQE